MKRLRIAMITRNFATHGGGAERYAVAITEQLAARHELHVFAQAIEHDDARITYHRLPAMRKPRWLNQWVFSLATKHPLTIESTAGQYFQRQATA